MQKCGLPLVTKFAALAPRFVKLQRPPPEMRIFLPSRSACSSTMTERLRLPASIAHINPAAPPPMTITSQFILRKKNCGVRNGSRARVEIYLTQIRDRNLCRLQGRCQRRSADFQTSGPLDRSRPADWEIGDTAGSETCATAWQILSTALSA